MLIFAWQYLKGIFFNKVNMKSKQGAFCWKKKHVISRNSFSPNVYTTFIFSDIRKNIYKRSINH